MRYVAVDTETFLIEAGIQAPRLVCLSHWDGSNGTVLDARDGIDCFTLLIQDRDVCLVGHNIAFDLGVLVAADPSLLPLVFQAVSEGRIRDTMIMQMLIDISEGTFEYRVTDEGTRVPAGRRLADLVKYHFRTVLDKSDDTWRLRYGSLVHLPISKWPAKAVEYSLDDAKWTYKVAEKLITECDKPPPTELLQVKTAWAFQLMRIYGVRTDPVVVEQCFENWSARKERAAVLLRQNGLLTPEGVLDQKTLASFIEKAAAAHDLPLTRTATGKVCTNKEVITDIVKATGGLETETEEDEYKPDQGGNSLFLSYRRYKKYEKLLANYLPRMRQATQIPFNPSWNVLVSSGRTSCGSEESAGNLQNLPRSGPVRECYVPRGPRYAVVEVPDDYVLQEGEYEDL